MNVVIEAWARRPRRAVLFDFNGTLSNDEPLLFPLFRDMFKESLDVELSESAYFEQLAGRSDREIIEAVVADHGGGDEGVIEDLLEVRRLRYLTMVDERSPIEDATVALVELLADRGVPCGIVTGAQRIDVDFVLERRGLREMFTAIVTEEDVVHGKPHPEGFLAGAALLGVEPSDVLVFEDSLFGLRAAKAAGMAVFGVVGTKTASELAEDADGVIDALGPDLLAEALAATTGETDA